MADSNNITLNQLRMALNKIKEKLDGKANNEHGIHVKYSTLVSPLEPGGSGLSGTTDTVSKGDHVHALPPYPTELKCPGELTIAFNDSVDTVYDGSMDLYLNISHTNVGAAPIYHATSSNLYGLSTNSVYGHAKASDTIPLVASSADVGSETSTFARGDHVHPAQKDITGNAGTATKLQTTRTLTVGRSGKEFNGTEDVIWSLDEMGAAPIESVEQATDSEIQNLLNSILK